MSLFFDSENHINKDPNDRVDAKAKVTGAAKYAAEYQVPNLAYGVFVQSTIAKGKIDKIDVKEAKKAAGVIDIMTFKNRPKTYGFSKAKRTKELRLGLRIFHDKTIHFSGQPIALVLADKLEQAQYAASLVKTSYHVETHIIDFQANISTAQPSKTPWLADKKRGDMSLLDSAAHKIEQVFEIATEVHSPMEPHATIALWEGDDKITIYDKNHAIKRAQEVVANTFKIPKENVTVKAEFVGGGFGSGLKVWSHTFAAIMAAKMINRPVKIALTRPQMFGLTGYRPQSWQRMTMGTDTEGKLVGIKHEAISQTSDFEDFGENIAGLSLMSYACPNVETSFRVMPLSLNTPLWMRAPGEATGAFALETAMDEMAEKLNINPLEFRLKNFAETHPDNNLPWSSNFLKECYETASKKFGWDKRNATPRSTRQGDYWVGYGMANGTWGSWRQAATCRAVLNSNGKLLLQSAASDMGPGTATTMVKIAENAMGLDREFITFELGNSAFPDAPGQGGSLTVASVGSAVHDACEDLKAKLFEFLTKEEKYKEIKKEDLVFANGKITHTANDAIQVTYNELIMKNNVTEIEVTTKSQSGDEQKKYAFQTFATHFAEVHVHAVTGVIRVKRFVSCVDAGKVINPKTAASQISGAVVMGVGMTLMEEMNYDYRYGRIVGGDFANYHIPVHADIPNIEVDFVNKPDPYLNKMGSKGLGEVGLIGCAAAIGNAIYNATGKRVRKLPFKVEDVM